MNEEDRRGTRTRESRTSADALYYQPLHLVSLYNISIIPFRTGGENLMQKKANVTRVNPPYRPYPKDGIRFEVLTKRIA